MCTVVQVLTVVIELSTEMCMALSWSEILSDHGLSHQHHSSAKSQSSYHFAEAHNQKAQLVLTIDSDPPNLCLLSE